MPPNQRGSLRIQTPVQNPVQRPYYFTQQRNNNENLTNEDALRIAKAQLKRYENDPEWNTSNNRNEAIEFLKYQRIPRLLRQIEARKPMCKKVTNAVTGGCSIQRHRTRKNRRPRKMTRRVR
jgi:hypothetical protein